MADNYNPFPPLEGLQTVQVQTKITNKKPLKQKPKQIDDITIEQSQYCRRLEYGEIITFTSRSPLYKRKIAGVFKEMRNDLIIILIMEPKPNYGLSAENKELLRAINLNEVFIKSVRRQTMEDMVRELSIVLAGLQRHCPSIDFSPYLHLNIFSEPELDQKFTCIVGKKKKFEQIHLSEIDSVELVYFYNSFIDLIEEAFDGFDSTFASYHMRKMRKRKSYEQ